MATYILVDTMNLFMRAKHVGGGKDLDMRVGMALHVMFNGVRKAWNDFSGDHVVFCLEGRSWRKDFYPEYKKNRKTKQAQRTPREVEEDEIFFESYNDLVEFLENKTNCSVIQNPQAEADDLIATWVQTHPNDNHVIVSTDSDFVQLLHDNVTLYNGVSEITYRRNEITNNRGQRMAFTIQSDGKIKVGKPDPDFEPEPDWVEYSLFLKCVRGDKSDNVFPAFPGARLRGSKNKVGIQEAYQDRDRGGFAYNNFMLQRWTDHHDQEHRVRDDYERNLHLIDLTAQPKEIQESCRETVAAAINKDKVSNVGIYFMKFAGQHDLQRLSEGATEFGTILNSGITNNTMVTQ